MVSSLSEPPHGGNGNDDGNDSGNCVDNGTDNCTGGSGDDDEYAASLRNAGETSLDSAATEDSFLREGRRAQVLYDHSVSTASSSESFAGIDSMDRIDGLSGNGGGGGAGMDENENEAPSSNTPMPALSPVSSSSATEASLPLSRLANLPYRTNRAVLLPGPFVVMQGSPGDGMANTVDSMPVLSMLEHEDEDEYFFDEDGDIENDLGDEESPSTDEAAAASTVAAPGGMNRNASRGSVNSIQDRIPRMVLEEMDGDEEDGKGTGTTSGRNGPVASLPTAPGTSIPAKNSASAAAAATEGGLHLPLGASSPLMHSAHHNPQMSPVRAVAGGGWNNNKAARTARQSSPSRRSRRSLGVPVDDDKLISANTSTQTSPPNVTTDSADAITNSDQTASTNGGSQNQQRQRRTRQGRRRRKSRSMKEAEHRWKEECREHELLSLEEMKQNVALAIQRLRRDRQRQAEQQRLHAQEVAQQQDGSVSSRSGGGGTDSLGVISSLIVIPADDSMDGWDVIDHRSWFQRDGSLVVLSALPHTSLHGVVAHPIRPSGHLSTKDTLPPGSAVTAVEVHTLDSRTLRPLNDLCCSNTSSSSSRGSSSIGNHITKQGTIELLRIESPVHGYVVSKVDGYSFLAPGLPSMYAHPSQWLWRVTCKLDGAYVREGLELISSHVETMPYGSFCRVKQKAVNSMGLNRLEVEASFDHVDSTASLSPSGEGEDEGSSSSSSSPRPRVINESENGSEVTVDDVSWKTSTVNGWISEFLNPLSGQRGVIVHPVPFPVPVLYRVTIPDGAIIRAGVELSTQTIGMAPCGTILSIVGRAFSDHPREQCLERLRLAGGGGWISVRLNNHPPEDRLIAELVGEDPAFDPVDPADFHFEAQKKVMRELRMGANPSTASRRRDSSSGGSSLEAGARGDAASASGTALRRQFSVANLSEINDDDDDDDDDDLMDRLSSVSDNDDDAGAVSSSTNVPTLFRSGVVACGSLGNGCHVMAENSGHHADHHQQNRCLICLSDERNATIVHGETGHIACCLTCARILKARGDNCPVCRLPIDLVIQHFWA